MRPNLTTFDRNAMPSNLVLVPEWQRFAEATLGDRAKWRKAVRLWAGSERGGALVARADGSLEVYTGRAGRIYKCTHRPGKWAWAD